MTILYSVITYEIGSLLPPYHKYNTRSQPP